MGKAYKPLVPAAAGMMRLTRQQYDNTIADIFGEGVRGEAALEPDESAEAFLSIGAAKVGTSPLGVEQYHKAALALADRIWESRANQPSLVGCAATQASDPCVTRALEAIGLRLFRRPLLAAERDAYVGIVGAGGAGAEKVALGFKYALATMLQSPHFLYLPSVGEVEPKSGLRRFTGHELASRLAYFLWNSTPDPALLDAAGRGALDSPEALGKEVARMLGRPRAHGVASRFFGEFWKVAKLEEGSKSKDTYPTWSQRLLDSYRREFETVIDTLASERKGDIRDLFDARESLGNADIARTYGLPQAPAELTKLTLPDVRAGLLTSGAVISANSPSDRTSPTHRGLFVVQHILCKEVPAPPDDVDEAAIENTPANASKSVRERLDEHRKNPSCAACHALFDPLGYTFEPFDGIGLHRTMEARKPIDATGELEGKRFTSVREIAAFLRGDPRTAHCFAKHLLAFATGHETTAGEEGLVEALGDGFAAEGHRFQDLITALVTSNGFRYFSAGE